MLFLLFLRLLLFLLLFDLFQVSQVVHCLDHAQVVLKRFRHDIFIEGLSNLVLSFKVLNIFVSFFLFLFIFAIDFNIPKDIKERFLFDLFSLLLSSFLLVLLLDDFDCDIFAFLPLHLIAEALLNHIIFKLELFMDLFVGKPFVLGKIEVNP